jgi:hypothetical protein
VVCDQASDQFRAVVHDKVRARLQRVVQVALEVLVRRIVGGEDPDSPLREGRADVVLGGERVAARDRDLGPRLGEKQRQVRRFRLQVDGHRDLAPAQRAVRQLLARDLVQDGRVLGDPLYLAVTLGG